jgi:AAA family ATP:ADP antiporter
MKLFTHNFGKFEEQEFRKFVRLGFVYFMVVGIYWTIRPLKDSVFMNLVGGKYIPFAKTVSLFLMIPMVAFYTKLFNIFTKEKIMNIVPTFYGIIILLFAGLIYMCEDNICTDTTIRNVIAYVWYFLVESWGAIAFALFWAVSTDVTTPKSAKQGFSFVYFIGQTAGIIFPLVFVRMPKMLGFTTNLLTLLFASAFPFIMILLTKYFFDKTPKELLKAFEGEGDKKVAKEKEPKEKTGFTEGLKLLFTHKYLLCIFLLIFMFEFIATIFDYNFKLAVDAAFSSSPVDRSSYLGLYASCVNFITVVFLLLGASNISRKLGLGISLCCVPLLLGGALFGFLTIDSLNFLFVLMVSAKALNYAVSNPSLKQLYIPTTPAVRFKAQAWIEVFGSRLSKESGSLFNMVLIPLQKVFGAISGKACYLNLAGIVCFPLIVLWFFVAMFLGKTHKKATTENKPVC